MRICILSGNHVRCMITYVLSMLFSDRNNAASLATRYPRHDFFFFSSSGGGVKIKLKLPHLLIVHESDGVHGRVRAAADLCFVLAAQARKLSFSASLGWAEEAQKTPRREQRRRCSYHQSLELRILYVFGRFAWLSWRLADRAGGESRLATAMFFVRCHRRGTLCYDLCVVVSAAVAPVATRWGSRFIASVVVVDYAYTATDCLGDIGRVRT